MAGVEATSDPLIGQNLAHFRVETVLGEGGMGVVYRATDERLRRAVALKVLPDALAGDPERRRRFLREARAAAAVSHPNIAAVYDIGEASGHVFIAMELLSGETLRAHMARGLTQDEALRIARDVAKGLAQAHASGVVHRDLKPENVMVTVDGGVKVLDFGLAKVVDVKASVSATGATESQVTAEGRVMGTPAYMSPEQVEGRADIDARSDIFSFGAMLYEMISGQRPFRGDTSIAVLYSVLHRDPEPLDALSPGAPPVVLAVVARCLRKERQERFASGREISSALEPDVPRLTEPTSGKAPPAPRLSTLSGMGTGHGATVVAGTSAGPRVAEARPRGSGLWVATAAVAAILAVGGGLWTQRQRVVTITDQPVPATSVPEARSEYVAGLQFLHDNAWRPAQQRFTRAVALDPTMALAHLRLAMLLIDKPDAARAEFASAMGLRSQLGPRDVALMDALEPVIGRVHKDPALATTRVEALSSRYPLDVEILDWLGILASNKPELGLAAARRATALDPRDGQGWQNLGELERRMGDAEAARSAFAHGAGSADNLAALAVLDFALGRCEESEREIRRYVDLDPVIGTQYLASGEAAMARPEAALRELLDQHVKALPEQDRAREATQADIDLAIRAGRFDAALAALERQTALVGSTNDFALHQTLAMNHVQTLLEVGDAADAARIARDFVVRSESWTRWAGVGADRGVDRVPWLDRIAQSFPHEGDAGRLKWIDEQVRVGTTPSLIWAFAWAVPARTPGEATAALGALADDRRLALPALAVLPSTPFWDGTITAATGHVYLLAGRPTEALPYLQRATATCMGLVDQFDQVHAKLDLGLALEQAGDTKGACVAFATVLAQWGDAKPRSVSAETARGGVTRLGCAP